MDMNKLKLNELIEEIEYLKEAEELLLQIYINVGVYNLEILDENFNYPRPLAKTLSTMIRDHFKFDDSE